MRKLHVIVIWVALLLTAASAVSVFITLRDYRESQRPGYVNQPEEQKALLHAGLLVSGACSVPALLACVIALFTVARLNKPNRMKEETNHTPDFIHQPTPAAASSSHEA